MVLSFIGTLPDSLNDMNCMYETENGLIGVSTGSSVPPLPPFPNSTHGGESEEDNGSEETEGDEEVFSENDDSFASPPTPVPIDSSSSDGISDHSVAQIELFFSSRFVRVGVCQCHATLTDPSLESPVKGVFLLQSYLDRQLPTQVNAAQLVLCTGKTFHVIWTRPISITGPDALIIKDDEERLVLGPDTFIDFTGTKQRREDFVQVVKGALQRLRIHVSQDKSARKKAIKEYRKSQKLKLKVKKTHISIPCEFSHVTRFTHRHANYEPNGAEVS